MIFCITFHKYARSFSVSRCSHHCFVVIASLRSFLLFLFLTGIFSFSSKVLPQMQFYFRIESRSLNRRWIRVKVPVVSSLGSGDWSSQVQVDSWEMIINNMFLCFFLYLFQNLDNYQNVIIRYLVAQAQARRGPKTFFFLGFPCLYIVFVSSRYIIKR